MQAHVSLFTALPLSCVQALLIKPCHLLCCNFLQGGQGALIPDSRVECVASNHKILVAVDSGKVFVTVGLSSA